MATSKAQYHRDVINQVLKLVDLPIHKAHLAADALRARVDEVPDEQELLAGVADFWLDLAKLEGAVRRRAKDPPSPFYPVRRMLVAPKGQVADWDLAWRMKDIANILTGSKSRRAPTLMRELLGKQPMMMAFVDGAQMVVGHAAWLPEEAAGLPLENLDVRWLAPEDALRRRWLYKDESTTWLELMKAARRIDEAELEGIQRDFNTGEAKAATRKPDRV